MRKKDRGEKQLIFHPKVPNCERCRKTCQSRAVNVHYFSVEHNSPRNYNPLCCIKLESHDTRLHAFLHAC